MVKVKSAFTNQMTTTLTKHKTGLTTIIIIATAAFAYIKPQAFVDLWLTRDQQGQLLFNVEQYQQASNTFKNTQWQAYSNYGAENFKNAATLYGQYKNTANQLAKANALAHGREYIKARDLYQFILDSEPNNKMASTNILVVQKIIDEVNRMSKSQAPEEGESIKDLEDEPQTGDGAEHNEAPQTKKIEQLSAEQLLLDPKLNEMWLRQVQKNPAHFLSQKFFMQNAQQAASIHKSDKQK